MGVVIEFLFGMENGWALIPGLLLSLVIAFAGLYACYIGGIKGILGAVLLLIGAYGIYETSSLLYRAFSDFKRRYEDEEVGRMVSRWLEVVR